MTDTPHNGGTTWDDVQTICESETTTAEESVRAFWEYIDNL